MVRVVVAVLVLFAVANVVAYTRQHDLLGDADRPALGRARDLEVLALRSGSEEIRERDAVYHRLARELRGATLHMDLALSEQHGWILAGLADADVVVSRREFVRIRQLLAEPLVKAASYRTHLEGRTVVVLLQPGEREYVLARIGTKPRGRLLVAPMRAFVAAGGVL